METPGSQSSLHRANLERVVRAVRLAGSLTQAEIARDDRAVRGHGLQHRPRTEGRRDRRGHAHLRGRPPGLQRLALSGDAGHRDRRGLRPHPPAASRSATSPTRCWPSESEPLDVGRLLDQGFDRAEQLVSRLIESTGVDRAKIAGVGLGVPGPIDVESGTLGSTAILPGWGGTKPAEELAGPAGRAGAGGQRRQPRRPGRAGLGQRPGGVDLAYIKVASGVGAGLVIDGKIYRGPGRHSGRNRAYHPRRVRSGLPLRQPRLPGDLRRSTLRAGRCCAARPRHRPDDGGRGAAGPDGRPRLAVG